MVMLSTIGQSKVPTSAVVMVNYNDVLVLVTSHSLAQLSCCCCLWCGCWREDQLEKSY